MGEVRKAWNELRHGSSLGDAAPTLSFRPRYPLKHLVEKRAWASSYNPALDPLFFIIFKPLESQLITDDDVSFQEMGENYSA